VKRALLVSNPVASRVTPRVEHDVMAALRPFAEVELVHTERPLHAAELARTGADDGFEAVIVMAGDGTVNEVVNGVGARVPLGVLPCGGTSVLARAIGLSRDPTAAAGQIGEALVAGRERHLRLGVLNGRRFTFAAGVGLDADVVRRVDARGRAYGRRPGDLYFALQVGRLVARGDYRRARATLTVAGRTERVGFLIAANLHPWSYVGPRPLLAAPLARADTALDLLAPHALRRRDVPRLARYLLVTGAHAHRADARIVYLHDVAEAVLTCDEPLPGEVDGDDIGDLTRAELGVDDEGARLLV
jgi:diacylglycerol kinase family enzyme